MDQDGLTIRHAVERDLDRLAAMEAACFPAAEAATRETLKKRLQVFPDHFWLLEGGGRLLGAINGMTTSRDTLTDEMYSAPWLHEESGPWQMLFGVTTLPECQGRGYASRLMERVIADCRAQGRRGIVLTCKESLRPFYERFGYQNEGLSASEHGGAVWYEMRLIL